MRKVIASELVSLDGVMESPEKWHFPEGAGACGLQGVQHRCRLPHVPADAQ